MSVGGRVAVASKARAMDLGPCMDNEGAGMIRALGWTGTGRSYEWSSGVKFGPTGNSAASRAKGISTCCHLGGDEGSERVCGSQHPPALCRHCCRGGAVSKPSTPHNPRGARHPLAIRTFHLSFPLGCCLSFPTGLVVLFLYSL